MAGGRSTAPTRRRLGMAACTHGRARLAAPTARPILKGKGDLSNACGQLHRPRLQPVQCVVQRAYSGRWSMPFGHRPHIARARCHACRSGPRSQWFDYGGCSRRRTALSSAGWATYGSDESSEVREAGRQQLGALCTHRPASGRIVRTHGSVQGRFPAWSTWVVRKPPRAAQALNLASSSGY
jgi:hypothetical protein